MIMRSFHRKTWIWLLCLLMCSCGNPKKTEPVKSSDSLPQTTYQIQPDTVAATKTNEPVANPVTYPPTTQVQISPKKPVIEKPQVPAATAATTTNFTEVTKTYGFRVISAPQNTFGYEVSTNGRPMVHQENVPGMPGNQGFKSKEQAEKTARFIITKLEKNIMPPSVTEKELDSLGVLK
jgi:hypothetical protein